MRPGSSPRSKEAASPSTARRLRLTATDPLRRGRTRMSRGGAAAATFPTRFADILFAEVPGPDGQVPKTPLAVGGLTALVLLIIRDAGVICIRIVLICIDMDGNTC